LLEELIPLAAVFCIFGWIPMAVYFKHKIRLEEVRSQRGEKTDGETLAAIAELRREVQALRDTTTKFDLSFDAGLSRLEERVDRLDAERAAGVSVAAPAAPVAAPTPAAAPATPPSAWYAGNGAEEPAALRNGRG
jgi:hypothetical protein